jgi:hypothetical protein
MRTETKATSLHMHRHDLNDPSYAQSYLVGSKIEKRRPFGRSRQRKRRDDVEKAAITRVYLKEETGFSATFDAKSQCDSPQSTFSLCFMFCVFLDANQSGSLGILRIIVSP